MNQLISVRAIISNNDKVLLIRRANGRNSILGKYELPGGKLGYNEQPEDCLDKYIKKDTNLEVKNSQLFDVFTYIDHDNRNTQYVFIVYLISLISPMPINLSQNYDHYHWQKILFLRPELLTESTQLLLDISHKAIKGSINNNIQNLSHVIIYSDGGSRGNPGPSASGYVIMDSRNNVICQGGVYLGITNNDQAEYNGLLLGLQKAVELGYVKTIDFRLDSMLVVNQINGLYKIGNSDLRLVNEKIKRLILKFEKVKFSHVHREFNQLADGVVNKILDNYK